MPHAEKRVLLGFLCWLGVLCAGTVAMLSHAYAVVEAGPAPASLPPVGLTTEPGLPVVLMFIHPKCPCTRASIAELGRILAAHPERTVSAHVLVYSPGGKPDSWAEADNWKAAEAISGVRVSHDRDGALAARFGAGASGHTLVYHPGGALLYSGGITAARGHMGPSVGGVNAGKALRGEVGIPSAPAFGCPIVGDADV